MLDSFPRPGKDPEKETFLVNKGWKFACLMK
jgi:hypothetical protein